jgi:hypothetical protein
MRRLVTLNYIYGNKEMAYLLRNGLQRATIKECNEQEPKGDDYGKCSAAWNWIRRLVGNGKELGYRQVCQSQQ